MPLSPAEEQDMDSAASAINSCVLLCDIFVIGSEAAVGLKYDDENMFVPMIVLIEKAASADNIVRTAEDLGVPVINNIMLAKNLATYGKAGESIPEASYRDVSLLFARVGSQKGRALSPKKPRKKSQSSSAKIRRPLSVELGGSLFALTGEEAGRKSLIDQPLEAARRKIVRLLGFAIPRFRVSFNPRLRKDEYRILFKGLEAGRGRQDMGWYADPDSEMPFACKLKMMDSLANIKAAAAAVSAVIVRHANEIMRRRMPELLGRDDVQAILDSAEEKYPVVTGEVKTLLSLGIIREIFQGLVSEDVSLRHTAVILETLADWASFGPAPSEVIIEQVRQALKRQICLQYTDDALTLRVLTIDQKLEKSVSSRAPESSAGGFDLAATDLENAVSSAVSLMEKKGFPPVVLCSPKARSRLKEATRKNIPNLAVLSYMEIPSDITVEPVGEIRHKG